MFYYITQQWYIIFVVIAVTVIKIILLCGAIVGGV
jgi:hypothetical protein